MFGSKQHYIQFGPHLIHRKYGNEHFLIVGTTGSGKTVTLEATMRSVVDAPLPVRACVYDPKTELLPILYDLAHDDEERVKSGESIVKVLNPLDARCFAWDLANDILSPVGARQLATILVPETTGGRDGDSFFDSAVRDLIVAALLVFINCTPRKGAWTFRDVLLAVSFENYTRWLFDFAEQETNVALPTVGRVRDAYLDCDARTASNIRATVSTRLAPFEPVAACWDAARIEGRLVSLTEWASDDSRDILVLGNEETARSSIDVVNRALFKRMSELIIGRRELTSEERSSGANQTWFFLDEAREAKKLDGLSSLLTRSRSRGGCVAITFQEYAGLVEEYGEHVANEIVGQCNNGAYLRIGSQSTAKWAVDSFGTSLQRARSNGVSMGESSSHSVNSAEEERGLLYSSDFIYMEPASRENGISGFYRLAGHHPKSRREAFGNFMPEQFKRTRKHESENSPWLAPFMPRPVEDQYLKPWDRSDWARLGFPGDPPSWRKGQTVREQTVSEMMQEYLDSKSRSL